MIRSTLSVTLSAALLMPAPALANGFQGTRNDDVAYVRSDDVSADTTWDGGPGIDTLVLKDTSLTELIDAGAVVKNFESFRSSYTTRVGADKLGLGARTFRYNWHADASIGDFFFTVDALDKAGRVVSSMEITVLAKETRRESSTVRITRGGLEGTHHVLEGTAHTDTLTRDAKLNEVLEWMLEDRGFISPVPPGDQDPQAIVGCFIFPVGSAVCLAGLAVTIAVGCCTNPGTGGTGA